MNPLYIFSRFFKHQTAQYLIGIPFPTFSGFAISLFLFFTSTQATAQGSRAGDSLELVALYNATGGANWTNKTNWLTANPINTWYGITLANGRVTNIRLFNNQLSGIIPNFNMSNLQQLYISGNQLSGSIPNFNLPNLSYLGLSNNQLSGNIPNFNLPKLTYLDIQSTLLSGNIPNFNLSNLQYLYLNHNKLNGIIPNFNLPNLKYMDLSNNELLSGSLPNFDLPNLENLKIDFTQLSGSIPNFNLPKLQSLSLSVNRLTGSIPNFNLPNLKSLACSDNQLSGNLPNFDLPNLTNMGFSGNQLSGSLPNFNLPNLATLWLNNNQLSGSIPNFNLPNLQEIWLFYNQLSGPIPNFDKLPNLTGFGFQENQLSGPIPNFNKLPKLNSFSLSSNQLNGCIPDSIKINCPLITAAGGDISSNTNLATQNWANYWNNNKGACSLVDTTSCRYKDSLQLVALYNATGGANWTNKTNWLTANPINTWYGITLNAQGCVINIGLLGNQLSGTIPNLNIPSLELLYLQFNQLSGTIPNFNMPNLQNLNLESNKLSGTIPNFNMPNLKYLNLNTNQLTGTIPGFSLPNLLHLYLYSNRLSGGIPNFNLPNLLFLALGYNQLTGAIPNYNSLQLQYLWLNNNQLSGSIPNFTLPNLKQLYLNNNQLTGTIPNFNMLNLEDFRLNSNQLAGTIPNFNMPNLKYFLLDSNRLSGNIPIIQATGNFRCQNNQFTFSGILPNVPTIIMKTYAPQDSIFKDTTYQITEGSSLTIDLGIDAVIPTNIYKWYKNNVFVDSIVGSNKRVFNPIALTNAGVWTCRVTNPNAPLLTLYSRKATVVVNPSCRTSDSLELVALYNATGGANWTNKTNWLTANPIDTWHGVTVNAQGCVTCIDLDGIANCLDSQGGGNNLIGNIPSLSLSNLQSLYLGDNQLSGSIPNFNLPNLQRLFLTSNQLSGSIPNFSFSKLFYLSLNNNQLSGNIPNFNFPNLAYLSLSSNQLSGNIPNFNFPNLAYLSLSSNQLSGSIPNFNFPNLTYLALSFNQLSGNIPNFNFPNLRNLRLGNNQLSGNIPLINTRVEFQCQNNKYTFDGVLPNVPPITAKTYAPQDSIFKDTTYQITEGSSLTIDLGIDTALTTNKYVYFKNGIRFDSSNVNKLILRGIAACDAATYTAQVTNTAAPLLTLYSRKAKVVVTGSTPSRSLDTLICNGKTYRLPLGRVVNAAGNYTDTLKNVRNCDSLIITTRLTIAPATVTTTQNPVLCSGQTFTLPNGLIVNNATNYRDTVRNRNGCDSLIRIVNVTKSANPTTTTLNPNICLGQTYTLPNGQTVTPSVNTTYRDTLKTQNGCDSLYRITNLTVNALPSISNNPTLSNIVCNGQNNGAISLTVVGGTPNYTFNWSSPNGFSSTNQNISNLKKGDYQLTVTDSKGCKTTSNTLTIAEPTALTIGAVTIGSDSCQKAKGHITIGNMTGGNGGYTFLWNNGATSQNLRNLIANNYTLTVTDSKNCKASAAFTVQNNAATFAPLRSVTLCSKDSFQLPISLKWVKKAGFYNDTTYNQYGCYHIIPIQVSFIKTLNAVDDDAEVVGNTNEIDILFLTNDNIAANLVDATIKRQPNIGSVVKQGDDIFHVTTPRRGNGIMNFSYQICYKTCKNDCDTANVTIRMTNRNLFDNIQTSITPNGDGKNDVLDVPDIDWAKYPKNKIELFNRWGQRVFFADPYNRDWNGKNTEGSDLPAGDYFFIMTLSVGEGKVIVGSVYLKR